MNKTIAVILLTLAGVTSSSAAQQPVTTITSGTGTSGLNLKQYNDTYINPRLTNIQANDTDLYTSKADKSCFANSTAFNACFSLDWPTGFDTAGNYTVTGAWDFTGASVTGIEGSLPTLTEGQIIIGGTGGAPASGQTLVVVTAITSTTHPSLITADADPVMESMGLMNLDYGNLNTAENIIPTLPQSYSGINSIVSALQRDTALEGKCTTVSVCAASYNVLTVLPTVPENSGHTVIRPNITGTSKMMLTWSDFDLTRVPSKSFLVGTTTEGLQRIADRWRFSTEIFGVKTDIAPAGYSEGGRAFRASSMIDDYGAGMASAWGNDFMVLASDDHNLEDKKPALASMISFGLDLYASIFLPPSPRDRFWGQGATQSPGKFPPAALFAALSVNNTFLTNLSGESSHLAEYDETHGPHELGQIAHGTDAKPLWGDRKFDSDALNIASYWGALFKGQRYDGATGTVVTPGNKEGYDPHGYIDGPPSYPDTLYMSSTLGGQKSLAAQMLLIPRIRQAVNYDRIITFANDRTNNGRDTKDDPCVTPDSRETSVCEPYPSGGGCVYYGVTWGPDPNAPGDCIKTPTTPYTKVGRFALTDASSITPGYVVGQVESDWEEIMALDVETPVVPPSSSSLLRRFPDGIRSIKDHLFALPE